MKSIVRSIKNEYNNYDCGERLVRQLTCNEHTPPSIQKLRQLSILLSDTDAYQFNTIVIMVFKRLCDYNTIHHVEKSLFCIEYLLKYGDTRFVTYCQTNEESISTLNNYRYTVDGQDYGCNVRSYAKRIATLLQNNENLKQVRAEAKFSFYYKLLTHYMYEHDIIITFTNYCDKKRLNTLDILKDIQNPINNSCIYKYMQSKLKWNDYETKQFIHVLETVIYNKLFNNFCTDSKRLDRNTFKQFLTNWNDIHIDIDTIIRYVNGNTSFLTLNRFIKTMQLLCYLCFGQIKLKFKPVKNDFIFIEYTYIPDVPFITYLLTMAPLKHEIKLPNTDAIMELFKNKIKQRHSISNNDCVKIIAHNNSLYGSNNDIFVHHKIKSKQIDSLMATIKQKKEIKMNDLYTDLCGVMKPFINENINQSLHKYIAKRDIVFGFVRLNYNYNHSLPIELKLLIEQFTVFKISNKLPLTIQAKWYDNDNKKYETEEIVYNGYSEPKQIFVLQKKNHLKFNFHYNDPFAHY